MLFRSTPRGTVEAQATGVFSTIVGGIVQESGLNNALRFGTNANSALNGVELRGDLNLTGGSSTVRILNGLVLRNETNTGNGTANLTSNARMGFGGVQTFNNATINMSGSADVTVETAASVLTLGSGAVIQGSGGIGATQFFQGGAVTLINQGIVRGNVSGQLLAIGSNSRALKMISHPFIDLPSGLVAGDPDAFDGIYTRNITYTMTSLERRASLLGAVDRFQSPIVNAARPDIVMEEALGRNQLIYVQAPSNLYKLQAPAIVLSDQFMGQSRAIIDPATREVVAHVPDSTPDDVDQAVAAARRAFDEGPWPHMNPVERAAVLGRFSAKLGTPVNVNFLSGVFSTIVFIAATQIAGGSAQATFNVMIGIVLTFTTLSYILIFPTVIKLRYSHPHVNRPYKIPGGMAGVWFCGVITTAWAVFASIVAIFPGFLDHQLLNNADLPTDVSRAKYTVIALVAIAVITGGSDAPAMGFVSLVPLVTGLYRRRTERIVWLVVSLVGIGSMVIDRIHRTRRVLAANEKGLLESEPGAGAVKTCIGGLMTRSISRTTKR